MVYIVSLSRSIQSLLDKGKVVNRDRFLQSLAIRAPEFVDRRACQLFEHMSMILSILHPSVQLAYGALSMAIFDPVEEICGFFITVVPSIGTSSSPVRWGEPFVKTNKVCKFGDEHLVTR